MLTKEHIKARVRGKKIVPDQIDLNDQGAKATAAAVLKIFGDAKGHSLAEVREDLADHSGDPLISGAFFKLMTDRCEFEDFDDRLAADRWKMFEVSKTTRIADRHLSIAAFKKAASDRLSMPIELLQQGIYADLPELKKIQSVPEFSADELLNRYNIAQIQGLLLKAHSLTISVDSTDLLAIRQLFHQIKFHRLLAELSVDRKKKKTVITLSGPLAQFDQASAYGLQLAMFFPHLLSFEGWSALADIEHKRGKIYSLALDSSAELLPIYKVRSSYVPAELTLFVDTFNGLTDQFIAERGGQVQNLGQEQYLIPDITITSHKGGGIYYLELFHKWHASQLKPRIQMLEQSKISNVLLGVARSVAKAGDMEKHLNDSCWFDKNGFLFSEFPTAKRVFSLISGLCRQE